ncbi:crotonobetainyl-CoA--carnitine CoA-transferase [bacterium]|nr:crotonobetainyl-CoA--carnitine CoA-transferase [bacterium]
MTNKKIHTKPLSSKKEDSLRDGFINLYKKCPIPKNEILANLNLFIKRQDISKILFLNEIYKKIIPVHGVIMELGTRWGRNLALFESLRGIYEPYNLSRKIIGFDTFTGFPKIDNKDGGSKITTKGAYATTENYNEYLEQILDYQEQESPLSHIKKFEVVKGDSSETIKKYFRDNPETIVALAYFDFDIYSPTKDCLEALKGHITKGTILGFDELNAHDFPGETIALKESLGLDKYKIKRNKFSSIQSYIVIE